MAEIEGNHGFPPSSICILFQGWSFLCAYVATSTLDLASDWSHMKTYYDQFYSDLSKQALPLLL